MGDGRKITLCLKTTFIETNQWTSTVALGWIPWESYHPRTADGSEKNKKEKQDFVHRKV